MGTENIYQIEDVMNEELETHHHELAQMAGPFNSMGKSAHGGHHGGGGWKVAYVDFVATVMAFFLLMGLLNATTEEQRKGISSYFGAVPIAYRFGRQ